MAFTESAEQTLAVVVGLHRTLVKYNQIKSHFQAGWRLENRLTPLWNCLTLNKSGTPGCQTSASFVMDDFHPIHARLYNGPQPNIAQVQTNKTLPNLAATYEHSSLENFTMQSNTLIFSYYTVLQSCLTSNRQTWGWDRIENIEHIYLVCVCARVSSLKAVRP